MTSHPYSPKTHLPLAQGVKEGKGDGLVSSFPHPLQNSLWRWTGVPISHCRPFV